jgi:hypothetical protein
MDSRGEDSLMDADFRTWLSERLDRVDARLGNIDITLARHDENLAEHMRRTDLLEQRDREIAETLQPIKQHVDRVKFVGIIIAAVMSVVGLAVGVASYFKH